MRKRIVVSLAFACLLLAVGNALGQSLQWAKQAGGVDFDAAEDVAVDGDGNIFAIGMFQGEATFGAGETNETTLLAVGLIPGPGQDVFVAKYDDTGALVWARSFGGTNAAGTNSGLNFGWGIAVDEAGNSYASGTLDRFTSFVDFGNGVTLTDPGAFVVKYDTNGDASWATTIDPGSTGLAVDVDGVGSVYVTGGVPQPLGGVGMGIWKLDSSGSVAWMSQADEGDGLGICVDGAGNSYVAGWFSGTATFGEGEANETTLTAGGTSDGFLAKYDGTGFLVWAKQNLSTAGSQASSIAVDGAGNSYVSGWFLGTTFGPGEANETTPTSIDGTTDAYVAKYDELGNLAWVKHHGGPTHVDFGEDVAVDNKGNSFVTGSSFRFITFAPGEADETTIFPGEGQFVYVAKYDTDGDWVWATIALSDELQFSALMVGSGISVDDAGTIHVAGAFVGSTTFGAGEANETVLVSDGGIDVFVARFLDDTFVPIADQIGAIIRGLRRLVEDDQLSQSAAFVLLPMLRQAEASAQLGDDVSTEFFLIGFVQIVRNGVQNGNISDQVGRRLVARARETIDCL